MEETGGSGEIQIPHLPQATVCVPHSPLLPQLPSPRVQVNKEHCKLDIELKHTALQHLLIMSISPLHTENMY